MTVRNFGLVRLSGRSAAELDLALRARRLWEEIGGKVLGVRAVDPVLRIRLPTST
ncbi:hypothetical protein [Nocardia sp. NPDC004260]